MWVLRRGDGSVTTGWALMPLRLFLGVTFLYAGLNKLANPDFFRDSSPISIHTQLAGAARTSPIHGLLSHLVSIAPLIGASIAVGEVAIGIGTLLGLFSRVAAIGGMAVSFSLFLSVSYHSSPYFTGSDIVFFFAWTPLVLAGAAGAPALDTWFAQRRPPSATGQGALSRRDVLSRGVVTGVVAAGALVLSGLVAAIGRAAGGTTNAASPGTSTLTTGGATTTTTTTPTAGKPPGSTTTTAAPPAGTDVGPASSVPVGGSASFTDPKSGDPALVIQQPAGRFTAFDAVCPHAGCTVGYVASARIIACPCHGSEFDAATGGVLRGPASSGLTPIKIVEGPNGGLYVQ
jgi:thiosulfate dehydrogenase [quinone] large subunit